MLGVRNLGQDSAQLDHEDEGNEHGPGGKKRVLPGFITTKTPELESIDGLKRRFDEASKYCDLDQLGIAPQCGFASTEEGNALTPDQQRAKLELVVQTAEAIWGEV